MWKECFEPLPKMAAWYQIIYWIMPVIGLIILTILNTGRNPWPLLPGFYVAAQGLVLLPLLWRKGAPPWAIAFMIVTAVAVLWTTIFGWPFQ